MPGPSTTQSQTKWILLGASAIALASTVAFWPALHGGFILDDDGLLTNNRLIKAPDGLYRIWFTTEPVDYWPITNTSFWLEWRLWELNPTGYHVANLALHIANSLLLWLILRKLAIPGAFLAALLFAIHPVNVESVAWISQRKGLLAMVFCLLSILWYLREEETRGRVAIKTSNWNAILTTGRWYWLSLIAFLLAMLSKGSVAILPPLLLLIVWWQRRRLTVSDFLRTVPFWVIAIALTGVNIWCQARLSEEPFRTADFAERLAGAGAVVWFYLSKAILPIHLAFIYPQWQVHTGAWLWWLPTAAAVAVTGLLFWQRNNRWGRPLLFAWSFFCVALVPVMGFTDVGFMKYSLVADHYQYIALIAVIASIAAAWSYWHSQARGALRTAAIVAAVALLGTFLLLTWHQSHLYANSLTLYAATLQENPESWLLHFNLGNALDNTRRPEEAILQYRQAILLNPNYVEAHYNFGNVLANSGQTQAAIDEYQHVLQLKPDWAPDVHCAIGVIHATAGHPQLAADEYQQAVDLQPDSAEFHFNLGNALLALDRTQESAEQYRQALKLKPDFADARNKLNSIEVPGNNLPDAVARYQQILQQDPNSAEAHYNLGNALTRVGRGQPAIEHFHQALRLKPNFPQAANGLGAALLSTGKPQEAQGYFEQALKLNPDYPEACANLALAYSQTNNPPQAIAAAEKAIQLARAKHQTAMAIQLEKWLADYRSKHPNLMPALPEAISPK